jgi:glycosyltransferase involved in cell wall biosynthesis
MVAMLLAHRALRTWRNAVDLFIAPSSFLAAQVARGGIPLDKIVVKPNFTAVPLPAPSRIERRHALYVGRLTAEEGVLTLIEASKSISDMRLVIVGDGPERSRLAKMISECAMRNVDLIGEQPRVNVQSLLQSAVFLVLPSEWPQPFGLVAAEAFSGGMPVIGARSGAISEIVHDLLSGLPFEPGKSNELSSRVRWAIAHPHELRKMGERAQRVYTEKYGPHTNDPVLIDAYRKAINYFETVEHRLTSALSSDLTASHSTRS